MHDGRELVLIYQVGKVASSSIRATIQHLPQYEIHQVHRLVADNVERVQREHRLRGWTPPPADIGPSGAGALQRYLNPRRPAKIITLVREPIGRNISYYFQNLDKIHGRRAAHELPLQTLIDGFTENYPYSDDPLTWFDYEFAPALGVDVYASGFQAGMAAHRWQSGPYDILLLRCDTDDSQKLAALRDFFALPGLEMRYANITDTKPGAAANRAFRETVRFPEDYLDRMLDNRFTRFFFDADSIARIRAHYSRGTIVPKDLQR